jgi:hypothetical protein
MMPFLASLLDGKKTPPQAGTAGALAPHTAFAAAAPAHAQHRQRSPGGCACSAGRGRGGRALAFTRSRLRGAAPRLADRHPSVGLNSGRDAAGRRLPLGAGGGLQWWARGAGASSRRAADTAEPQQSQARGASLRLKQRSPQESAGCRPGVDMLSVAPRGAGGRQQGHRRWRGGCERRGKQSARELWGAQGGGRRGRGAGRAGGCTQEPAALLPKPPAAERTHWRAQAQGATAKAHARSQPKHKLPTAGLCQTSHKVSAAAH